LDINNSTVTNISNIQDSSNASSSTNDLGKDSFFKILAAQLQYQDPMEGGDNTAYVAQLAQFSTLEQMENMNNNLLESIKRQDVQYANQLLGSEIIFAEGETLYQGIVEAYTIKNNEPYMVMGEKEFAISQIQAILSEKDNDLPVESEPETTE